MEDAIINYETFDEKSHWFHAGNLIYWNSVENLFKSLDDEYKKSDKKIVYRGSSEAKFRMFNSAQRNFLPTEKFDSNFDGNYYFELYENYIISSMKNVLSWNNNTVENYFKYNNIKYNNCFALLSFMQHYGIPTPLLDFTHNPFVALYFAIGDHDGKVTNNKEKIIDDFISIYKVYKPTIVHESFHYFLTKDNPDLTSINYQNLSRCQRLYLLSDEKTEFKVFNNPNVINQEGLFYYNNHPFCPLEVAYCRFINEIVSSHKVHDNVKSKIDSKFGYCWNIHKSLIPAIRQKLNSMGINESFLFPNFKLITAGYGL